MASPLGMCEKQRPALPQQNTLKKASVGTELTTSGEVHSPKYRDRQVATLTYTTLFINPNVLTAPDNSKQTAEDCPNYINTLQLFRQKGVTP